jgi:hypothetical protein
MKMNWKCPSMPIPAGNPPPTPPPGVRRDRPKGIKDQLGNAKEYWRLLGNTYKLWNLCMAD